jgi:hypothetical protein
MIFSGEAVFGPSTVIDVFDKSLRLYPAVTDVGRIDYSPPTVANGCARADIDQSRVKRDPFAAEMGQSGIGRTEEQGSQGREYSQHYGCPAQAIRGRENVRQDSSWMLSHRRQVGAANDQGEQDGEVDAEGRPRAN